MNLAKIDMKVTLFYEKTTKQQKINAKRNVKTRGSSKIMINYNSKTSHFTRHSATRRLAHSQNTIKSQNRNMLNPENNFSCEASIPAVPKPLLHPALIGGWREAGGEAGREAEEEAGGGLRGRLGERLGERLRQRGCEIELCRNGLCRTEHCKTELCKMEFCKIEVYKRELCMR